jgi:hypothetical protein
MSYHCLVRRWLPLEHMYSRQTTSHGGGTGTTENNDFYKTINALKKLDRKG